MERPRVEAEVGAYSLPLISRHNPIDVAQWAQALLLTVFYAIPAIRCFYMAGFVDFDVWWHLRTGEWIMQHHALPHIEPFSSFAAGRPWNAYSWLFELLILQLFQQLGLTGIVAYTIGMVLIFGCAVAPNDPASAIRFHDGAITDLCCVLIVWPC